MFGERVAKVVKGKNGLSFFLLRLLNNKVLTDRVVQYTSPRYSGSLC